MRRDLKNNKELNKQSLKYNKYVLSGDKTNLLDFIIIKLLIGFCFTALVIISYAIRGKMISFIGLIMSFILMKQRLFVGFSNFHTEQAFLKSTFNEVWEKEPEYLTSSCTRFREDVIANPYLFRYWQFAKNSFFPKRRNFATFHLTERKVVDDIEKALLNTNISSICINDTSMLTKDDFYYIDSHIISMLNHKFPQKSSFEM